MHCLAFNGSESFDYEERVDYCNMLYFMFSFEALLIPDMLYAVLRYVIDNLLIWLMKTPGEEGKLPLKIAKRIILNLPANEINETIFHGSIPYCMLASRGLTGHLLLVLACIQSSN